MGSKHSADYDATLRVFPSGTLPHTHRSSPQRKSMALCLIPLILLGASCAGAAIQRVVLRTNNARFGSMTRTDACQVAGNVFSQLIGSDTIEYETSTQSAYSVRRHCIIREWSVLCSTSGGQYLLRINADSRRVYAINRMDDSSPTAHINEPLVSIGELADDSRISHAQAEVCARSYIGLIGISSRNLTPITNRNRGTFVATSELSEPEWNFTFCNSAKQNRNHLVTISVRSKDGRLEHLWNPVLSL